MKNKLKKFLLLFGVISTILVACNFDETHDHFHSENGKKSNFKIQKVKSEIFSKNTQLIGKLNTNKQLLKSIDSNNRIITSSDNSFYINTEEATYIEEENGLHSYTFFINRNLDNVFLENLLISSQEDGTYKSFIVRYNISAQEVEDLKNGINVDTNNRISIEIIDDVNFTQGISNKIIYTPCVTGTNKFWQCSNNVDGHMPGIPGPPSCSADSFSYVINVQWGLCASDDGTMDDIPGGGGSSDGGGGSSNPDSNYDGSDTSIHGNGSNSLNTAPVFDDPNPKKDPCDMIKKLQADTTFKGRMANLIDAARLWSFERCYVMYNAPSPTTTNNYTYQSFQGTISSPESGYTGNTTMQGIIHSHYNGLLSIFSAGDLQDLYFKLKNYPEITDDFFMGLVTSSNTAYLLQVPDRATFIAFGDKYLANDDKIKDFMKEKMLEKYNINPDNSRTDNELGFLKMMADLNMGVSLASVDFNATTPATGTVINTWTKKVYDKKTRTVIPSNCN